MLNALIRWSIARRGLVLLASALLLALGARTALRLPVDVLPDLTKPTVTLLTEAPGYAPEEVESLVTIPLENALMGVQGVARIRTVNDVGLSLVHVEFDWGTDILRARQFVQERLVGLDESLPEGIRPHLTPVASLMGNILLLGLADPSGKTPPAELRALADWTVARRLQSIPGIAEVLAMGGGVKQILVHPNPERMMAHGVSFAELREAAARSVKNSSGGFLTSSAREIMVRNLGMSADPEAIADTVLRPDPERPLLLRDVADVVWDIAPMRGDAGMGSHLFGGDEGYSGVILSVTKSPGFDTLKLTAEVEKAFRETVAGLPDGIKGLTLYRQSDFIELSIGNLTEALRDGAIMVAVILLLFMGNLRVALITLTAIPLSLAITLLVFERFGLGVNSMTLGGLAVAIGMVVDDAIVDVENTFRRLRENAALPAPLSKGDLILKASLEVRSSILYATVLIILVFLPLMALGGVEGRLFSPIAVATIVSMAASFLVSMTVTNALAYYLLWPKAGGEALDPWLVRRLKSLFEWTWLRPALAQPWMVIAVTIALMAWAALIHLRMGGNFLPAFLEPSAVVATAAPPGTSLEQTTRIADLAMGQLLEIPGVETVGYRVGRAEKGDHVVPVSTVEFDVEFSEAGERERERVLAEIRATMRAIPGTFSAVSGPLADRIGHMLSGVPAKIAVKLHGGDLAELRRLGDEVVQIARTIPGLEEARGEAQSPIPQLRIEVDRPRAKVHGITPGELNERLAALLGGEKVAEIHEGTRVIDLVLRLPADWRESPLRLADLPVGEGTGPRVPLDAVADLRQASGPNVILRENGHRRFVVSINPSVTDLSTVARTLEERVAAELRLPPGYGIGFEGEYQARQEAARIILWMSLLILVLIAALLQNYFRSWPLVLLVLANIPMALTGGVFLTRLTLDNTSIATLVGYIAIAGIATRNTIMMVSHYLHLMRHEGEGFDVAMVRRGTLERLVPVLMTALTAGIALLPLVFAAGEPGKEILHPVAIVIVGGLISSTLLGLGTTPALFFHFCRQAAARSIDRQAAATE